MGLVSVFGIQCDGDDCEAKTGLHLLESDAKEDALESGWIGKDGEGWWCRPCLFRIMEEVRTEATPEATPQGGAG
jgi:hypothetical protein